MGHVSPQIAAKFAKDVYFVRNDSRLEDFLDTPQFSQLKNKKLRLSAEVGSRLIHTRDNFGVCARGSGDFENDIFVIFRGTDYFNDWITDARFGLNSATTGSLVHAGFNQAFNSLRNELATFVSQQIGTHTIHFIGHSLGGAVANVAAEWAAANCGKKIKLYTFGSPRVGLGMGGFATKLTTALLPENIYRVYHGTDPVPMAPVFPFVHAPTFGQPYYLPHGGVVISFAAHKMIAYIHSVGGQSWSSLYSPEPQFSFNVIKQWLEHDSVENADSSTVWNKLNYAISHLIQTAAPTIGIPFMVGMTIADHLAMILQKGLEIASDVANWVFLLMRKMMRMLGMKVVETAEQITKQLLHLVLDRITRKIFQYIKHALKQI